MERRWFLGVDAGNTKTIAVISDETGALRGFGRGGCGDIYTHGTESAVSAWTRAISEALGMAGIGASDIAASGFSMAGADWPEDFADIERIVRERGWGRQFAVANDSIGGLLAGSPDGTGVAVVLGTGVAIGARGGDGSVFHPSFLLRAFGTLDPAADAVTASLYDELGIGPATSLTGRIKRIFNAGTVEQAVHLTTRREGRVAARSAVLGAVYEEAEKNDGEALRILRAFAKLCADYAVLSAERVGLAGSFPVVFSGGMLRHPSSWLRDEIIRLIRETNPEAVPLVSFAQPVLGALILAFGAEEGSLTDEIRMTLQRTDLPRTLFDTEAPRS